MPDNNFPTGAVLLLCVTGLVIMALWWRSVADAARRRAIRENLDEQVYGHPPSQITPNELAAQVAQREWAFGDAHAPIQPAPEQAHPFPQPEAQDSATASTHSTKENLMSIKITLAQANALRALRALKTSDKDGYKAARSTVFANIRQQFGIPDSVVLKVEVDNAASPDYLVVKGRPPKSKTVDYAVLQSDDQGRYAGAAPASKWVSVTLADVVSLLREQGETMESYTVVDGVPNISGMQAVPSESRVELAVDTDDRVYFRAE